jgi:large subunit ribosomal protein L3
MSLKFIGKKCGMTQMFDKTGNIIPCSVILAEPNFVVQVKSEASDGCNAVQLGGVKRKKTSKVMSGHFAKAQVEPCRYLLQSKVDKVEDYKVGQAIDVTHFKKGEMVDVTGVSKGKGFQGLMKLYNFSGGPAAHGSGFHRHAGSTGMRTTPGRCFKGGKRASRMGGDQVTVQNLEVIEIDEKRNLILVRGAIPGANGDFVFFRKAGKVKKASPKGKK